jgi:adenylosuccinate lyase
MLRSLLSLIRDLDVFEENIERNLELTKGLVFSQRILLALVEKGIEREKAYEAVQRNAMKSWERGSDFRELCLEDPLISEVLGKEILNSLFDVGYYTRYVDEIFDRFCVNQDKDG